MSVDFRHRRALGVCLFVLAFLIGPMNLPLYLLAFPGNYTTAVVGMSVALVSFVLGILVWRRRRAGVYGAAALGAAGSLLLLTLIVIAFIAPGAIIWFLFILSPLALSLVTGAVILGLTLSSMLSRTWNAGSE